MALLLHFPHFLFVNLYWVKRKNDKCASFFSQFSEVLWWDMHFSIMYVNRQRSPQTPKNHDTQIATSKIFHCLMNF
jgi:hypothetical protein